MEASGADVGMPAPLAATATLTTADDDLQRISQQIQRSIVYSACVLRD